MRKFYWTERGVSSTAFVSLFKIVSFEFDHWSPEHLLVIIVQSPFAWRAVDAYGSLIKFGAFNYTIVNYTVKLFVHVHNYKIFVLSKLNNQIILRLWTSIIEKELIHSQCTNIRVFLLNVISLLITFKFNSWFYI